MTSVEVHRRAMALFQEALELPDEERAGWLESQTADNADLRTNVLGLLEAHESTGGILDQPVLFGPEEIRRTLAERLGDTYDIIAEVGRGGMAFVFEASERKHDRRLALKVMRPEVAEAYGRERFEREVRLAAQLSHPNILGLIDSGEVDGLLYYAMPFIEGETLRERLDRDGAFQGPKAHTFLRAIASALDHAHDMGVIHRDLKPGNVLCAGDHPYLMDFGIAKTMDPEGAGDQALDLTRPGLALGTPRYMAPEQALGGLPIDDRVDLYAWGVLACEVLTGKRSVTPGLGLEIKELKRVALDRPDIPEGLMNLIEASLRANPADRIQSAAEIVHALDRAALSMNPTKVRLAGGVWTGRRVALGGAALLVAALLGVGLWPAPTEAPVGPLPVPVAVAPFVNETADPALTAIGRLAGDWIAQGLQQLGTVPVLPWPASLESAERAREGGRTADLTTFLADDLGAGTVITGSIYQVGDALQLAAVVTDAARGRIISAPEPLRTSRENAQDAIREIRNRIMASLAITEDDRLTSLSDFATAPPTFESYRDFDRGIDAFLAQDYAQASELFGAAWAKDTTFLVSRVYEARSLYNETRWNDVDATLAFLRIRRERLSEFSSLEVDFLEAMRTGQGERALRVAKDAAVLGPNSRAAWSAAAVAIQLNRPAEALDGLIRVDPNRGAMRGWAQYWTQLAHAHHLLGQFVAEERAAIEMRTRHPERRVSTVIQARALAAAGRKAELESLLADVLVMPRRTYWSYGAALVAAGQEFQAHGSKQDGAESLQAAVTWLEDELESDPTYRGHRFWLAEAYYSLGAWRESQIRLRSLVSDFPERAGYRGLLALATARVSGDRALAEPYLDPTPQYSQGDQLTYHARLALLLGDKDRGLSLLNEAILRGVDDFSWLHARAHLDFEPFVDDAQFIRLMSPRSGS